MSEAAKTCSLIGVAVVLALLAVFSRPRLSSTDSEGTKGKLLFPGWKEAAAAKSLAITNVDATNKLDEFEVADVDGKWVVPSHDNYPANAKDHVFKAASSIIGLKVHEVKSDKPGEQEEYGVVEPSEKALTSTSLAGFGRLVVVKDADGKDLARLIIGKEDKSTTQNGPSNLRFVRKAGQDRIYSVALDTDVLSTKFQDWVDTDILALKQPWDINRLLVRDYAIDDSIVRKEDIALDFNQSNAAWSVKKLTEFKDNKPQEIKLPADEELDSTKINDLKTNLSGLALVDVVRKPAGFIQKLKDGKEYLGDRQAVESLTRLRFFPVPQDNPTDIFSDGGDVTIGMKDGLEYTVRFGRSGFSLKSDSGDKKSAATSKDANKPKIERLVFVTARFNPDLIPKPVLEPLPEAKKPEPKKPEAKKPDEKKADEKKPEAKKPEAKKAEEPKPAAKKPDGKSPDAKSSEKKPADATKSSKAASHLSGELLALADPSDDAKKPDEPKKSADKVPATAAKAPAETKAAPAAKATDSKATDAKATEKGAADKKPAATAPADKKPGGKTTDGKKPESGKPAAAKPKSDIELAKEEEDRDAERKRIETENRRKQDEYDATVKQGKAHAKELNTRFADWYYMISEDDYKKVHVGLNDLVKKKAGAAEPSLGPARGNPFGNGGFHLPHP